MQQVGIELIPCGLMQVDADGVILDANSQLLTWIGRSKRDVVGQPARAFLAPMTADEPIASPTSPGVVVGADGSRRPVLVEVGTTDLEGRRTVVLFDATARWAFESQLESQHSLAKRTQTRLELVINSSIAFTEALTEVELANVLVETTRSAYAAEEAVVFLRDDAGAFQQVAGSSPFGHFDDVTELTRQALALRSAVKVSGLAEAASISTSVADAFAATGVQAMVVAPIRLRDQLLGILGVFFHHSRSFDEQASPLADALSGQAARAISGLRLQSRLAYAALHDEITGLPNRRYLEERMDGSPPQSGVRAILFVDLDGFKAVNDYLGHQAGDRLLAEVSRRLRASVREGDFVARYGGDEFVIVCDVANESAAADLAERIRVAIGAPYVMLAESMRVGASIGLSVIPSEAATAEFERLLRAADQAMYLAKSAGGNQVAFA